MGIYKHSEDDPCILNIGTRCRQVVSLMQWQIHSFENSPAHLPGTESQVSSLQPLTLQDELLWLFHTYPTLNKLQRDHKFWWHPSWQIMILFTINEMSWHHNLSHRSNTKWNVSSFPETTITLLSSKSNVFRYRDVHLFPTLWRFQMSG